MNILSPKITFTGLNDQAYAEPFRKLVQRNISSVGDRWLYKPGQLCLERKDVVGRARGILPYVGIVTITMNAYPNLFKCAFLACLSFSVLHYP